MGDFEDEHAAPPGSYENPADEAVYCNGRTLVVAARGPFGIVRAISVGTFGGQSHVKVLKEEIAKYVGLMTPDVYWSWHLYEGVPHYVGPLDRKALWETSNGIWLWRWKDAPEGTFNSELYKWDYRTDYGNKHWTAQTESAPTRLGDLPRGY